MRRAVELWHRNDVAAEIGDVRNRVVQGRLARANAQRFNAALQLDPRDANPMLDLAYTLFVIRRFPAASIAYDRLIAFVPDELAYKIEKQLFVTFMENRR